MTTHPVGMKIPVSVIQRYEPWPQDWPTEDNNGDFVLYADHKKIVEQLEAALTRANAATAAAYEVVSKQLEASRETFCYASPGSDEEFTSLLLGFDTAAGVIRALATPDQTPAMR